MSIVEMTDTVVDPGAVVIHLENAFLTDPAMMRSGRFESFAVFAVAW
jgi:hypothetical protein